MLNRIAIKNNVYSFYTGKREKKQNYRKDMNIKNKKD